MHILFYLGHPAHFHLFKNTISELGKDNQISILSKTKDILDKLLDYSGWNYYNILPEGRGDSKLSIGWGLLKRDVRMWRFTRGNRPDVLVGTSPEITHIGALLRIPSIVVNEDDADVVPFFANLAYPLASAILSPETCSLGKWESKGAKYNGFQKLAYLHPKRYKPDRHKIDHLFGAKDRYFLLRFVKLSAHHDTNITGITDEIAWRLIRRLQQYGNVWISSERVLSSDFDKYRIEINPLDIHHAISYASIFIGDSQSMTVESAMLGTPSIRVSDFVGRIGVLDSLEDKYHLTYGIQPKDTDHLFKIVNALLSEPNLQQEWHERRSHMLNEVIDVTAYFIWFIKNFPASFKIVKSDPNYPFRFK